MEACWCMQRINLSCQAEEGRLFWVVGAPGLHCIHTSAQLQAPAPHTTPPNFPYRVKPFLWLMTLQTTRRLAEGLRGPCAG